MMDSLNRLCMGQLIEFSELRKPRPPFLQKHAESPCTKGVKYEELRFCVLSGKSDRCLPKILFSNDIGDVFIQSDDYSEGFTKIHNPPKIPRSTLLLVQETKLEKFEGRNFPKSRYVFRILDAAVIDSDDIFNLPFDERIKAAEKMCSAVRMFGLNKDSCNVFTAEVLKLDDLERRKESFRTVNCESKVSIYFNEKDQLEFECRGMWVVCLLKDPWHLVWSTTQNNYYLFNATTGESMMCSKNTDGVATFTKFKGADCFTTFFDAISCKREDEKGCVRQWNWLSSFRGSNADNDPSDVFEKETSSNGMPTFQTLLKLKLAREQEIKISSTASISWSVTK